MRTQEWDEFKAFFFLISLCFTTTSRLYISQCRGPIGAHHVPALHHSCSLLTHAQTPTPDRPTIHHTFTRLGQDCLNRAEQRFPWRKVDWALKTKDEDTCSSRQMQLLAACPSSSNSTQGATLMQPLHRTALLS